MKSQGTPRELLSMVTKDNFNLNQFNIRKQVKPQHRQKKAAFHALNKAVNLNLVWLHIRKQNLAQNKPKKSVDYGLKQDI